MPERHRLYEDALAILLGAVVVSIGLTLNAKAMLVTSGVAGLALLGAYATGWSFSALFVAINAPFFVLSAVRLGWRSTARTVAAIALVAAFTRWMPGWLEIARVDPLFAALAGGALTGLGLLALFRHRTGLGGINILALYLQERYGWRAGTVQMGLDAAILLAACWVIPVDRVALSLVGAAVLNVIVGINHRPGRYTATS